MDIGALLRTENRTTIERWCESRAQTVYLGEHRILCRVLGNSMMLVDGRDLSVAPHLTLSGYWEMWVTQFLAKVIQPGMHCIDVGANFGYFTLLMAILTGQDGRVEAWEPNPNVSHLLRGTLTLNGLNDRVIVIQAAASDREGLATLSVPEELWGGASLDPDPKIRVVQHSIRSERLNLPLRKVDVIKIDAEGHEPAIWSGARELIATNPKLGVVMEFTRRRYADAAGFLTEIEAAGFALHRIGTDGAAHAIKQQEILASQADYEMLWVKRPNV